MSESSLRVIVLPSLVYSYFDLDFEQDEIRKPLFIKQETEWIAPPSILEYFSQEASIRQGEFS